MDIEERPIVVHFGNKSYMTRLGGWYWYGASKQTKLENDKRGKWMYFFEDQSFAQQICKKAIMEHVCYLCKCSDLEEQRTPKGVICFYLNGDDIENHKRVILFMMDNNLIPKTKTGRYYNNSFKFDYQTAAGEYGADFKGKIKLDEFIDLKTGRWIRDET